MGRSKKRGGEPEGASTPNPELLAETEEKLRQLGSPTFDLLGDMPVPKEIEAQASCALSDSLDDYIEHGYAGTKKLAPRLAQRLADTPDLRVAIERAVKLRGYVGKLSKYVDAIVKSVALMALLHDERASRHHVAELLGGPLSEESLRDLCKELPPPPKPMTDVAFARASRGLWYFRQPTDQARGPSLGPDTAGNRSRRMPSDSGCASPDDALTGAFPKHPP